MVLNIFNNPYFSPFSVVPVEVAQHIAGFIDKPALCSLRLTCRDFSFITVDVFGCTCLETVTTDLSKTSLLRLARLAQHPGFRGFVKHLSYTSSDGLFGEGFRWKHDFNELIDSLSHYAVSL